MAQSYRDLAVWQKGMAMVTEVYRASRDFPREEAYGLTNQMRRAAVSVPSNIAEGKGRGSEGEFLQFLKTVKGSLVELETQLEIATNLDYLAKGKADNLLVLTTDIGRMLSSLIVSVSQQKKVLAKR